ncbi:MAG TPA: hypothetical protein VM100_07360 [Longimicrobiales bacterium]|nr:hypothetical protein [Longimicrobiales bacterium]
MRLLTVLSALVLASSAQAQTATNETARYLETVRNDPSLVLAFLREMPKGADLHNHLSGAIYAESFIEWGAASGACIRLSDYVAVRAPCDSTSQPPLANALRNEDLRNRIIDQWSMRNWRPERESGHDHFFAAFSKFSAAGDGRSGDYLAEEVSRAASDRLSYVELMWTGGTAPDTASAGVRAMIERKNTLLGCGTPNAAPGCRVEVRFLYQVLRGLPIDLVRRMIITGFQLSSSDPNFVGLNLVMPEDCRVCMRDFSQHMAIIDSLHAVYPNVKTTLHAGELWPGLVPPEGLRFHIRESVEKGHARRIGHGVAVMHEDRAIELLREMARRDVAVEICLTSNAVILGVSGKEHPLATYLKYGVPVLLATDDQGVSRSDMTLEFKRAVEDQHLGYRTLKKMVQNSIKYSFAQEPVKQRLLKKLGEDFAAFESKWRVFDIPTTRTDR